MLYVGFYVQTCFTGPFRGSVASKPGNSKLSNFAGWKSELNGSNSGNQTFNSGNQTSEAGNLRVPGLDATDPTLAGSSYGSLRVFWCRVTHDRRVTWMFSNDPSANIIIL